MLISAVIPWAVFTRYVLNSAASWPEPLAILLTIVLTFIGAAAGYRLNLHMNISYFAERLPPRGQRMLDILVQLLMALIALFMIVYGERLVEVTWHNTIADFPFLSVGVTYLPIPVGGVCLLLFIIERMFLGAPPDPLRRAPRRRILRLNGRQIMDIFILLATMLICFLIGMPIAYSLAMAAIAGALSIGIPLEALMLKISDGVSKVAMLTIPFFVLAGAIMAEGGMARRLVAFADVLVGFTRLRGGLSIVNVLATTFLSGISGSAVADTSAIGSVMIPQMEKTGYPRVFATNLTITSSVQALLVPPSHNAVLYSLATGGTISISALFMAGVFPGLLLGFSLIILCLVIAYREGHPRGQTVAGQGRRQDQHRCGLGPDHAGHHPRRHPGRHLHRDRSRRGRLPLGVLRHHVHLPRLSLARPAGAAAPDPAHGRDGDDPDRLRLQRRLHHGADADAGAR